MQTRYIATKLGRKSDPKNPHPPMVPNGNLFSTKARAFVYDWDKLEPVDFTQETFVPVINKSVYLMGGRMHEWVRTSLIEDFYIHGDTDNSSDKICMNYEDAHMLTGIEFQDGDILLTTMNSLYFLKKVKKEEEEKEEE